MRRRNRRNALWLVVLLAGTGGAAEIIEYAEPDGTIKTAAVDRVTKETPEDFNARILVGGRPRRLNIPSRRIVSFRRGDPDAVNQWSKRLATGKRLYATGQLATQGTSGAVTPGAEETFEKIAYSTEKGVPGEEAAYAALPWHNEYALFYLIETRLRMGTEGGKNEAKLQQALANVEEFKARSVRKTSIEWEVPAEQGATRKAKVYCWGDSRLLPQVILLEARIRAALGDTAKAAETFDAVIDLAKKGEAPPHMMVEAFMRKAEMESAGQPSEKQESIYRAAGSVLASLARVEKEDFGREVLNRAANRALLRGADLLRQSAEQQKVTWDTPLNRYQQLKSGEGQRDPAVYIGAQAGIGACLVEKGQGEPAYDALLEVVVKGGGDPEQMALALYYLGRAAKLFGDEIDRQGGKGDFLRNEAGRWWSDLQERYPTSHWAEKAK